MKYSALEIARLLGRNAPTAEQIKVIEAPLQPMLVVAGAGSGKTETMAARVVYLVANGYVRADQVLGLTFTRKGASELQERVQTRLKQLAAALGDNVGTISGSSGDEAEPPGEPMVATYNSFAAAVVREFGLWAGVEPAARLLSEASAWQVASDLVAGYSGDLETDLAPATVTGHLLKLNSELTEHLRTPTELREYLTKLGAHIESLAGPSLKESRDLAEKLQLRLRYLELIEQYTTRKRNDDYLSFSDQIALGAQLATRVPQIGETYRSRFKVVLLDEYQDTSHAQISLLAGLFGHGHPVTAVGDPNQAIFAWRGASASGLAHFPRDFPMSDGRSAPVYSLATTWRNDQAILSAANQVSEPLRHLSALVEVPKLALSPGAAERAANGDPGSVETAVTTTDVDEAELIADWIAARWDDPELLTRWHGDTSGGQIAAAVLCRARKQFRPIADALERRGIPVEIVGLGGLLETPEVVDLVALLQVVADPTRGDWLLRLLRGPLVNLGIADLHALGSWANDLAREKSRTQDEAATEAVVTSDEVDNRSLIAALEQLPPLGKPARDGRIISPTGHARLSALAAKLAELRKLSHLTLPEVCALAERALGLDIEVMIANQFGRGTGRHNLDAFRSVAADFARNANAPTLIGFLSWLDAAKEQERGLDLPVQEVNKAAVQIITVHASKGLEWDVVAVPGLVLKNFPSGDFAGGNPSDKAWLFDGGALPYELRGDRNDLPTLNWRAVETHKDLKAEINSFILESGEHELSGERRLAYVAFTRAKHDLLLTGYWWGSQQKSHTISPFLTELVEAGLVSDSDWAEPPAPDESNPTAGAIDTAIWPQPPSETEFQLQAAAEKVRAARTRRSSGSIASEQKLPETQNLPTILGVPLPELARILIAERDAKEVLEVQFPARVSTSGLVRLAQSREDFATQLRRPIPTKPTVQAHRGTRFHEWVQSHFSPTGTIFDLEELPSAEESLLDEAALDAMKNQFRNSPWAARTPIKIEQEIHTTVGGITVIARIDAIFDDPENPGHHLIVDWKTGTPPWDQKDKAAREVQLAIYRLAWSRYSGHPIEKVSAAFHYVGSGETVRPEKLLSEAELENLIMG